MIIRCEVSLDLGKTWRLATISCEEERAEQLVGVTWSH